MDLLNMIVLIVVIKHVSTENGKGFVKNVEEKVYANHLGAMYK